MHEGFVNFNAGTLGASMVEGRISQGVVVGDGSDIGGGASIMGTLSGGGTQRVSIGERALLGANSGIGISLGDDCVVEAGLYVTAGTKVVVADAAPTASGALPTVKAESLSGRNGLLFRRNSLTGAVEVLQRSGEGILLNAALHACAGRHGLPRPGRAGSPGLAPPRRRGVEHEPQAEREQRDRGDGDREGVLASGRRKRDDVELHDPDGP
jgi:hypothetical protein